MKHIRIYLSVVCVLLIFSSLHAQAPKRDTTIKKIVFTPQFNSQDTMTDIILGMPTILVSARRPSIDIYIEEFSMIEEHTSTDIFNPPYRYSIDIDKNIFIIGNPYALSTCKNPPRILHSLHGVNILVQNQ